MRDLAFVAFLLILFGFGLRRPFFFVLGYAYIEIVSPQLWSYYLLNSVSISLIFFAAAVIGWLITDARRGLHFGPRQWLMLLLLAWAGWTTLNADFPVEALQKWDWVWKALVFAIFLPLTLQSRLRLEALLLFMILSLSTIIIIGGIKTLATGGGYGVLNLGVTSNTGFYESSIISTIAIAAIPIILFLAKHGTIFPPDRKVKLFTAALVFACLLIPVGTEARTGLICVGVLAVLMLRNTKRRFLYLSLVIAGTLIALPLLPSSFGKRMETIQTYHADQSASTRLAVWAWTWNYVQEHPFGGGFEVYLQNRLSYTTASGASGYAGVSGPAQVTDAARAFHSSYFEMLGEQGFLGLLLWLLLHFSGLLQMELLRRRNAKDEVDKPWIAPLATALQSSHLIYLVGSLFVGIAFQSFAYMLTGVEIGLAAYCNRALRARQKGPWGQRTSIPGPS